MTRPARRFRGPLTFLGLLLVGALAPGCAFAAGVTVVTGGASAVTPTSATVSGTVDLNGNSLATDPTGPACYFQYGTSAGTETTKVACTSNPGPSGPTTVTANLTGLSGASTYHYTLEVEYGGVAGLTASTQGGGDRSFTTPSATLTPTATSAPATGVTGTAATLNGAVDAENWSITACAFVLTAAGGATRQIACPSTPTGTSATNLSVPAGGLAEDTRYDYVIRVTYTTSTGAATVTSPASSFTTPAATLSAPTNLTPTSVTLNATVNPEGLPVSACTFYYGTSAPTLKTIPCTVSPDAITGTTPVAVNANVSGLSQKTDYLYTVVLTTPGGYTAAPGGTFTTPAIPPPPTAVTRTASAIGATSAVVNATVDPQGQAVQACEFEYSVDPYPSSSTTGGDLALTEPCQTKPGANGEQAVSATVNDLAPGTRYYVRVLLLTTGGYVIANTTSFRTAAVATQPGVRILGVDGPSSVGADRLRVRFMHTGPAATRGYLCALARFRHGVPGVLRYRRCTSPVTYRHLAHGPYLFAVRAGNANGFGAAVTRRLVV